MTTAVLRVPQTNFVLTVDTGYGVHAVRVVDATKLGAGDPVTSRVSFPTPFTLNSGVAFVAPDLVFLTTAEGIVQALKLDTTTGQLTRDDARSITLDPTRDANGNPAKWYSSGVAASPDRTRLIVSSVLSPTLFVYDVAAGSATFGKKLGQVELPASDAYGVWFDPADGAHAYVSLWASRAVVEVDVSTPAAPKVARSFATDKDPQQVAFLDARWMAVGNDLGDTLSLVDRTSGAVRSLPIESGGLYGVEPSSLAWDAAHGRLYATLAGVNAVAAYDVNLTKDPPEVTPAGRLGTGWWPSGVAVMDDGALVVTSLRGHGSGPRPLHFAVEDNDTA
jgi:DNA-binding beta-propeller fold protein YncE